jgi:multiple sugar transport system substrate-binding protein
MSRISRRALVGSALLVGGVSVLAACGQVASPTAPAPAPKAEAPKAEAPKAEAPKAAGPAPAAKVVNISLITAEKATTRPTLGPLFADFNKEAPNINIELLTGTWGEVQQKWTAAIAAGKAIHLMENGWSGAGATLDGVVDLLPLFARDKIDVAKTFKQPGIDLWSYEGKLYGMPITMSVDALAFNLDMFEKAGLNPPPVDLNDKAWNMDKFLEVARKLTKDDRTEFGHGGGVSCDNTAGISTGTY